MKSYTDIEQSKKLAKILPIESADMYFYDKDAFTGALSAFNGGVLIRDSNNEFPNKTTPAWSLTALLGVLPTIDDEFEPQLHRSLDKYRCTYEGEEDSSGLWGVADNPVDACYEMILTLHKLNLL